MEPFFFQKPKFNYWPNPYSPSNTYFNKSNYQYTNEHKNISNNLLEEQTEDTQKKTTSNGRLYNDDIIIIGLLFLLYTEKVNDTYLFMALIMLLLS